MPSHSVKLAVILICMQELQPAQEENFIAGMQEAHLILFFHPV